ncbi:Serine protease inhibitor (serpin family) [Labilithrix luteola]|uniref:Serine protease inhibitor (Serpin family) n=1 Tax=Labilithrix luteola TaxID=1391654 RepID=A0A0K1Q0J0_9BACT|nr:serpin family protein [Labilithrix luteola]AKU99293.1 Serine protease inhibitor (serpin family) [Labilithrix luteola]
MKQVMKAWTLPALLSILAVAAGCSSSPSSSTSPENDVTVVSSRLSRDTSPEVSYEETVSLRDGNRQFATDLYGTLRNAPLFANKNLFFSPYSISVALGMTYAGAAGATADELAKTMHFTLPRDRVHVAINALDLALNARPKATDTQSPLSLHVVDSMWGAPQTTFETPFLDTLAVNYGAGVRLTDFEKDAEAARVRINDWVSRETENKIQDLIGRGDAISGITRFVLVNAIYFKAGWTAKFSKDATAPGTFHGASGDAPVEMMKQESEFSYAEGDGYRAIDLPYDGGLSFTAVLPSDLPSFEASLDPAKIASIEASFASAYVALQLPKFEIKGESFSLKESLEKQGMKTLFSGAADLSGISKSEHLLVGDVIHQAFIGVDEEGTEAAAATAVIGDAICDCTTTPPKKIELTIDKPFVFFIRDTMTGTILFTGRYVGG